MQNTIRITGGTFRGRNLKTPDTAATHPMGSRERLAIFNAISEKIPGANVLDAYAGSGALGIEAISRGAKTATFIEQNKKAVNTIKANLKTLNLTGNTNVIAQKISNSAPLVNPTSIVNSASLTNPTSIVNPASLTNPTSLTLDLSGPNFSVIFIDPPYDNFMPADFKNLSKNLTPGGFLVLSHPSNIENPATIFPDLKLLSTKSYAAAHISLFTK